jgi:hypothetical protein
MKVDLILGLFYAEFMNAGIAVYLRHIAVQCIEMAKECSDSNTAEKLQGLSIELAEKAEHVETLFGVTDEEQAQSQKSSGTSP